MKPWEFEALTPWEFLQMQDGYRWRLTHPAPEAVWLATVVLNMFGGGEGALPWTPETLMGLTPEGIKGNG
ncbi:MAG: hypothetical protein AB7I50_00505 [Vicinamibacterales bacterium]